MADGEVIFEVTADTSDLVSELSSAESKVKKSTQNIEDDFEKTATSSKSLGTETEKTTNKTETYREEIDKASQSTKEYSENTDNASDKTSKLGSALGTSATLIGTAMVAVGTVSVSLADDMDKAMNGYIASTGKGVDETEKYQNVLENIYTNNYGENFEDIADKMALVTQQMGDLDDSELQSIVEKGYLMSDTFGIEMTESIRAVNSMMTQFGISSDEAYELMTQGAKSGLNQNGDLADQLAEYSVYYSDLGYSAEEMFNAVANGAKDGVYQIDYLNDAVKEFGICSKDGSDTSREAFEALGLDADAMTEAFANGGDEAKASFDLIAEKLAECDDKVLQNQIGVALFGTRFEDLGADAVLALTNTEGAIDDTLDSLSEVEDIKYDSFGEMLEGLMRSVETLLIPLGEQLIPILTDIVNMLMPMIEELLPVLIGFLGELLPPITQILEKILPPLIEFIALLIENIMPVIEQIMPTLLLLLESLLPPLIEILQAILPPLIEVLNILLEPILELIQNLLPVWITLLDALSPLISILTPIIKFLAETISGTLGSAFDFIMPMFEGFIDILSNIIDFIVNVFTGNWEGAWDNIVNIFRTIFNIIPSIVESILNGAISVINGLISGVNFITGAVGIPAIPSIPNVSLPRFKLGIDYVPEDEMPALLHRGEAVLTASEADIYRKLGGKGSLERMLSESVPQSNSSESNTSDNNDCGKIIILLNTIVTKLDALANLTIKIDKQTIGKLLSPTINKELGNTSDLEKRSKF
ncbi:MAG: phage tail tape measure protein [Clostridia bacterium]